MCKLYKIFFQKVGENNNKKITNKFSEIEEKIIKQNYERKKNKIFHVFCYLQDRINSTFI
jgi:hypothetical protein